MTKKMLVFDLDGSVVDFYGVKGWLEDLHNENPRPYEIAKPLYDMKVFNNLISELKTKGYRIAITTWLAKGSTKHYDNIVRKAKLEWLKKYGFKYDEIHLLKYGRTKADATRSYGGHQILIDDNEKIRNGWHLGDTIDATKDIIPLLKALIQGF